MSRETEVLAEDEQAFLGRQQQILLAGGGVPSIVGPRSMESPMRTSALGKGTTRSPSTPGLQNSPKKVMSLTYVLK